jgi:hypothetical protein
METQRSNADSAALLDDPGYDEKLCTAKIKGVNLAQFETLHLTETLFPRKAMLPSTKLRKIQHTIRSISNTPCLKLSGK